MITARDGGGAPLGTTANAISSVSLRPPLLLACLADDSETLAAIRESGRFAVNVLAAHQREHSDRFAARGEAAGPHEVAFEDHPLGVPVRPAPWRRSPARSRRSTAPATTTSSSATPVRSPATTPPPSRCSSTAAPTPSSPSRRTTLPPDPDLLVVLGSTTVPGRLRRALEGAIDRAAAAGVAAELLDLAEVELTFADGRDPADLGDDTASVIERIAAAGSLIFATPVYRGSLTGALKNVFDQLPVPALDGKVAGLVAMGASDHFLGPERHLRDILAFFGAVPIPVAVYLTGDDFPDGVPGERCEEVLDELFAGTVAVAAALADAPTLGPSPLAARAIKPAAPR